MSKPLGNDGKMQTEAPDVPFISVHHVRAGGHDLKKGPDLPPAGGDDGIESKYVRCKICGFIYDDTKISTGSGYGNTSTKPVVTTNDDGSTTVNDNVLDINNGAGCPFCFTSDVMIGD